jgi:dimethyladenosine transferase (EC 2.1.1.-)
LIKPLKRLGQNYLIDKNIINKIISIINPQKDDIIIEIGPGQGALTQYLASSSAKIFAFEIDKE